MNKILDLEAQSITTDVLKDKYFKGQESSVEQQQFRVATGLVACEAEPSIWKKTFTQAFEGGFIPAGRIQSACGTSLTGATLINCFAQPVGDSLRGMTDGNPGIYPAMEMAAETMSQGGGEGYNFSKIRPKGSKIKSKKAPASGPLSYMDVFDASCKTVKSAGGRRGAQMAVLDINHPDIEDFIWAKREEGRLRNFNLSVGISDEFMQLVETGGELELVHKAEPSDEEIASGAYQRKDGLWVYRAINASELFDQVMKSNYDHAEPGFLLLDRINRENNLHYVEEINTTNPCGEVPLPPYGCCCLGSNNLTKFVSQPFSKSSEFDFDKFREVVSIGVRILDNVLDVTNWPLEEQRLEAMSKRRTGQGFLGLADTLVMLGIRYDSDEGRSFAAKVIEVMRDAAYMASVELAKEKGAFPLFDADKYLSSGFAKRLPKKIRSAIRKHGIRNSHLISLAPTGTIALAFADNAAGGIEPAFSWTAKRKRILQDDTKEEVIVEGHALRVYKALGHDTNNLPETFVSAMNISVTDHMEMVAAVAPFVDSAISKTVNVPTDYPYEDFKGLYINAWKRGLKGITTYRPNHNLESVLSIVNEKEDNNAGLDTSDPDRRIVMKLPEQGALSNQRWVDRPNYPQGNAAWSYMIEHPQGFKFSVFIGHVENGSNHPFEVWVNGAEQPRFLGAISKLLSMDMRSKDRAWVAMKLDSLMKVKGDDAFQWPMPNGTAEGDLRMLPSIVSAVAQMVKYRCQELGSLESDETPMIDALFSPKEPKAGPDGTLSWTVDIMNHQTGDDFVMFIKEADVDGKSVPYSIWFSGDYPKILDGLCKVLSIDMRISDPAWIGKKIRKLLSFPEPQGDFIAKVPGKAKSRSYPSTIAYVAALLLHRYNMLGILDDDALPVEPVGTISFPMDENVVLLNRSVGAMEVTPGAFCSECNSYSMVKYDGCTRCTSCGHDGGCG